MDGRTTALRLIRDGQAGLILDRAVTWRVHGAGWRFSTPLKTDLSSRIIMCVNILSRESLFRPTILLRDDGAAPNILVRLDVRARPHMNRMTDGLLLSGTHIHYWKAGVADKHAIPPGDTWPPPGVDENSRNVQVSDIERVFDWFCTTHHVGLGTHYEWQPPPLAEELQAATTPEGDEIP